MKIIRADVLGMCFGVRDALQALTEIETPVEVTIHGELVHNEIVLEQLQLRGFHSTAETARQALPATPAVLITAHGVSHAERQRLAEAGKQLLDTTCPLVTRAHDAAQALQRDGRHVLVIGRRSHVEVEGIVGDLSSYDVVGGAAEVRTYDSRRLGVMCQTTTPSRQVQAVRAAIAEKNPDADIRFIDTVCLPTKERQLALDRLIEQVEAVVVVGGSQSNNTRALAACCEERGRPAFHVQTAADLRGDWFAGFSTIGLTAGTSSLDATIAEVHAALAAM